MHKNTNALVKAIRLATLAVIAAPASVLAGGFSLNEQSASQMGVANAGAAANPENATTVLFNPAGMSQLSGTNISLGAIVFEIDAVGMFDTAVEALGKTFISTEISGGGTATARSARIAHKGVRNVLKHAGILEGELDLAPSVSIDTTAVGCYHFADLTGLMEPLVDLGEMVEEGEPLMRIWLTTVTGEPALTVRSKTAGILSGRHFPGLVKLGDCLAVVATVEG